MSLLKGDSGGGLVLPILSSDGSTYYNILIGIVSYGEPQSKLSNLSAAFPIFKALNALGLTSLESTLECQLICLGFRRKSVNEIKFVSLYQSQSFVNLKTCLTLFYIKESQDIYKYQQKRFLQLRIETN